jgi:hypothetical protein
MHPKATSTATNERKKVLKKRVTEKNVLNL